MKKAAALLLAASLAVSVCATPVFAAEGGGATTTPNMGSQLRKNTDTLGSGGVVMGSTDVYYKVTESYAWSIPATIDFGKDAGANNTSIVNATLDENVPGKKAEKESGGTVWKGTAPKVVVSKNVIGIGKKLQITLSTDYYDNDEFYVLSGTSEKLHYAITKLTPAGATGEKLTKDKNEVLSVDSGTNTAYQALEFKLTTAKGTNVSEKAGDYTGVVVFNSKIV